MSLPVSLLRFKPKPAFENTSLVFSLEDVFRDNSLYLIVNNFIVPIHYQ